MPPMRAGYEYADGPTGVVIDNRTDVSDEQVRMAIRDQWVELGGLQFGHPSSFQLYSTWAQGSMLARTPFRTPQSVIDEVKLARSVADTDDDIGAVIGEMIAIAFGDGVVNQHRDEKTLEFFDLMMGPTTTEMDLETVLEEMYREYLITASVTTLTVFARQRLQYFPLKSDTPVQAQLQVPNVGILPAENLRVITNDILRQGQLAFAPQEITLRNWLEEFLNPTTPAGRKAMMAMQETDAPGLFAGRVQIPP